MEILPVLFLFLCMPLDRTPPPIHAEQLALFPGYEYATKQRDAARIRCQHATRCYVYAYWNNRPEVDHWQAIKEECREVHQAWDCLCNCYFAWEGRLAGAVVVEIRSEACVEAQLRMIYAIIGPSAYYSGQLPGPVDVTRPPPRAEVVPLP